MFLLLFLTHGVNTIRDAGDTDGTSLPAYLQGMADGRFIGPRSFAAGPFINKGSTRWTNTLHVDSPVDAERIARELVRRGARCMKLYENLTVDEIAALERAAAEHGLVSLGHVPTKLGIEEARLKDAQHFFGVAPPASLPRDHVLDRLSWYEAVDAKRMVVVVRSAVENGLANTPTLVVTERLLTAGPEGRTDDPSLGLLPRFFREVIWHPQYGLPAYRRPDPARVRRLAAAHEKKLELVRRLYQAGALLRIGTDWQSFVVQGDALHRETKLFEQAGIPTAVVLRIATRDAALALGQEDLGTVRRGAVADLLLRSSDPTKDLSALRSMWAVCHQGALLRSVPLGRATRSPARPRPHLRAPGRRNPRPPLDVDHGPPFHRLTVSGAPARHLLGPMRSRWRFRPFDPPAPRLRLTGASPEPLPCQTPSKGLGQVITVARVARAPSERCRAR